MDGHNTMIEFYESQAQATRENIENFQKLRDVYARDDDKIQTFLTIIIEAHMQTLGHYEGQVETWKILKKNTLFLTVTKRMLDMDRCLTLEMECILMKIQQW